MKYSLIVLMIAMSWFSVSAQPNASGPAPKMQAAAIGHIYGKLIDSAGRPVGDASVVLLEIKVDAAGKKGKDLLVSGVSTKASGEFSFEELSIAKKYKLISF